MLISTFISTLTSWQLKITLRSLAAALNVLALSDRILLGKPRQVEISFQGSNESLHWHVTNEFKMDVTNEFKMDGSCNTTGKQTDPDLAAFLSFLSSNIHGSSQVNGHIGEWWCLHIKVSIAISYIEPLQ